MEILAHVYPLNVSTGGRPMILLSSSQNTRLTGWNSLRYWPAITRKPILSMQLFDGAFTGQSRTGGAAMEVNVGGLLKADPAALTYRWPGAIIDIYAVPDDFSTATLIFSGEVERHEIVDRTLKIEAAVRTRLFEVSVLTASYAGTGAAEGGADLKGRLKPMALGAPLNVEPVLIDAANSVYQVHGYGPIQGIITVYERAASFGASFGNYASYSALVTASIPPGRWASCLALGLFRLGAPAAGVITADVQGHNGTGWVTRAGDILRTAANLAGVVDGSMNVASILALNGSVSRPMSLYLTDQSTVLDMARAVASQCNAVAGVSWLGQLFTSSIAIGSPAVTLEVPAKRRPVALRSVEKPTSAPFWRIEMLARRNWRLHRPDEIAFTGNLIDRGEYDPAETYREGHIVDQSAAGGARWIYINPTPTAGNAPPTWPTVSNSFWEIHTPPTGWGGILNDGGKPADNATRNVDRGAWVSASLGTGYIVGDEVQDQGSTWGCILAHNKTALNGPPTLPTASNSTWRLRAAVGSPGASAKALLIVSDRQTITTNSAGSPSPAGQTTTFSLTKQGLSTASVVVRMRRLDGTALVASNWLAGSGTITGGVPDANAFTMTGDTITMAAADFTSARDSTNGVIVEVSHADGVQDLISVAIVPAGVDALIVTPDIYSATIPCDAGGVPLSGALPITITMQALVGTTNVTGSTTWGPPSMTGCSVTNLGGGQYRIDSVGADSGRFVITATNGGRSQTVAVTFAKAPAGRAAVSIRDDTLTQATSGLWITASDIFILPFGPGQTLNLAVSGLYGISGAPAQGSQGRIIARLMYRNVTDGGAWTQAGGEINGSFAVANYIVFPTEPDHVPGTIAGTRTGPAAPSTVKVFEVRLDLRLDGVAVAQSLAFTASII